MTVLNEWNNFYVIVGGICRRADRVAVRRHDFVANKQIDTSEMLAGAVATPIIVHFGAVLLLSALVSAPWHGFATVAVLLGLVGFSGVTYHNCMNHLDQVNELLSREPLPLPRLEIVDPGAWLCGLDGLLSMRFEHLNLIGYQSHGKIAASVAV